MSKDIIPAVSWSGLDVQSYLEIYHDIDAKEYVAKQDKFDSFFDNEMRSVLLSYEDEIVEFINNKIHEYVEENKEEIIKEIKKI